MSDCCSSSCDATSSPKKHLCPVNGKPYSQVSASTISHHLKQPWSWHTKAQSYYFCDDPGCKVVYFAEDDSVIQQSELRTSVGIKTQQPDSLICYCYGVTLQAAKAHPEIRKFVIKKTRAGECACDTRNPSGRCCLKDFPK